MYDSKALFHRRQNHQLLYDLRVGKQTTRLTYQNCKEDVPQVLALGYIHLDDCRIFNSGEMASSVSSAVSVIGRQVLRPGSGAEVLRAPDQTRCMQRCEVGQREEAKR